MSQQPILIVDDDPAMCAMLSETLAEEGFPTRIARDGSFALAAVRDDEPALVLLDARMPVLDGEGFLKAAQWLDPCPPVVLMSGDPGCRTLVMWRTVVGYLPKPVDLDVVVQTVVMHAGRGVRPSA